MEYLNNKYSRWYFNIINSARHKNTSTSEYYEKHHIIPSSLGGSDDSENLVLLTPREHFVCHLLLIRMTTGNAFYKMSFAVHMLSNANNIGAGRYVPSSRIYELVKKHYREAMINFWTDEKRAIQSERARIQWTGYSHKPETIEKMKNKTWSEKALQNRLNNCLANAEKRKGVPNPTQGERVFDRYVTTNMDLIKTIWNLYDSGVNRRQISIRLGITWDRVGYAVANREKILSKMGKLK